MAKNRIIHFGFWNNKDNNYPEYPMPVAGGKTFLKKDKLKSFLALLAIVEKKANCYRCKGWSNCRICGKDNGSETYSVDFKNFTIEWPIGYSHYLIRHKVAPDPVFVKLILVMYEKLKTYK